VLTTQHPLSAKVGTTSPRSGGRSVGMVHWRTKATEFFFNIFFCFPFDLCVCVTNELFHTDGNFSCGNVELQCISK
jgi:hypothetical protein